MKSEDIEKRMSANGYEVMCRDICGAELAIAPGEMLCIYNIIPQKHADDISFIQEYAGNLALLRKLLSSIFHNTLDDLPIYIEATIIFNDNITDDIKKFLDDNRISYLLGIDDNLFDLVFLQTVSPDDYDEEDYEAYKSYIGTAITYMKKNAENGGYQALLIKELLSNFIDHGDYIEFKKPIKGISMIQKGYVPGMTFRDAMAYAGRLNLGDFTDWQIPSADNLETLRQLFSDCAIPLYDGVFWSSSWFQDSGCSPDACEEDNCNLLDNDLYKKIHHAHYTFNFTTGLVSSISTGYTYAKHIAKDGPFPSNTSSNEVCNLFCIRASERWEDCSKINFNKFTTEELSLICKKPDYDNNDNSCNCRTDDE